MYRSVLEMADRHADACAPLLAPGSELARPCSAEPLHDTPTKGSRKHSAASTSRSGDAPRAALSAEVGHVVLSSLC